MPETEQTELVSAEQPSMAPKKDQRTETLNKGRKLFNDYFIVTLIFNNFSMF